MGAQIHTDTLQSRVIAIQLLASTPAANTWQVLILARTGHRLLAKPLVSWDWDKRYSQRKRYWTLTAYGKRDHVKSIQEEWENEYTFTECVVRARMVPQLWTNLMTWLSIPAVSLTLEAIPMTYPGENNSAEGHGKNHK